MLRHAQLHKMSFWVRLSPARHPPGRLCPILCDEAPALQTSRCMYRRQRPVSQANNASCWLWHAAVVGKGAAKSVGHHMSRKMSSALRCGQLYEDRYNDATNAGRMIGNPLDLKALQVHEAWGAVYSLPEHPGESVLLLPPALRRRGAHV